MRQAHQFSGDEYVCHQCGLNRGAVGLCAGFLRSSSNFLGSGVWQTAIFATHLNHLQCIFSNVYISISHPYSLKSPLNF